MALISISTVENTNSSFYVGGTHAKRGWNGCGVENEMQMINYLKDDDEVQPQKDELCFILLFKINVCFPSRYTPVHTSR